MKTLVYIEKRRLYAEGLVMLLKRARLFDRIFYIDDPKDCFKTFRNSNNDCRFLLIGNILQDRYWFIKEVKRFFPDVKVLLVYDFSDDIDNGSLEHLLCLVDGVISVDWTVVQLRRAFDYFLKEGVVVPKSIMFSFLRNFKEKVISVNSLFTGREKAILNYISKGKVNKEIGRLLGIKEKTVKNHINKIYTKLAVKTRAEAIFKASRLGLV